MLISIESQLQILILDNFYFYFFLSMQPLLMFAAILPRLHLVPTARWLERRKKALVEERVLDKASCPIKIHGDVNNQIKKQG
jgi:hypothetical protein